MNFSKKFTKFKAHISIFRIQLQINNKFILLDSRPLAGGSRPSSATKAMEIYRDVFQKEISG